MSLLDMLFDGVVQKKNYYMLKHINGSFKLLPKALELIESRQDCYTISRDPQSIEVTAENFRADNGRCYNAFASVTLFLPEEKAEAVANMFFWRITFRKNCDKELNEALTTVIQDALECVIRSCGNASVDELKNRFKAEALKRALVYHHITDNQISFSIREVT